MTLEQLQNFLSQYKNLNLCRTFFEESDKSYMLWIAFDPDVLEDEYVNTGEIDQIYNKVWYGSTIEEAINNYLNNN